jgi:hypothetical protein
MTDATPSRLGQANGAGDALALFLKVFGGEVMTEFHDANVFGEKHFVRTIKNGKSAQFPLIGAASSGYHTPGEFIDGGTIAHAEKVITIDDLLITNNFIANIDEAMNHYEVRGPYSQEMGQALAKAYDLNVGRCAILAARAADPLTEREGGTRIGNAAMDTNQDALRTALFTSAQKLDEKRVPGERWAFFRPAQYYLMAQDKTLIDRTLGGSGSIASGELPTVAGFPIVKTNHVPNADDSANTDLNAKYRADFSATYGIVMNRMAVGTVKLMDLAMEGQYEPRRQGTFMVGKLLVGHDWLRPACAVELYKG